MASIFNRSKSEPASTTLPRSVWSVGNLSPIAADLFGPLYKPVSIDKALAESIPAVTAVRDLIVSALGDLALVAYSAEGVESLTQPAWLTRSDGVQSTYSRNVMTLDDLYFYGLSLWLTTRGTKQPGAAYAPILTAEWISRDQWKIEDGQVIVADRRLYAEDFILFETPGKPGILRQGVNTLRAALDLELAARAKASAPPVWVSFSFTDDTRLTKEEGQAWVTNYLAAHSAGQPMVGLLPSGLEMDVKTGSGSDQFYESARNAYRNDVASFGNVPVFLVDGSTENSTNYANAQDMRNQLREQLALWTRPIEAALSQRKCMPGNQTVRLVPPADDALETPAPTPEPVQPTEPAAAPATPEEVTA